MSWLDKYSNGGKVQVLKEATPIGYKKSTVKPRKLTKEEQNLVDQEEMKYAQQNQQRLNDNNTEANNKTEEYQNNLKQREQIINLGYDTVKALDMTGITSIPDVAMAWSDGRFTYEDITEPLGALPLIGKGYKTIEGLKGSYDVINTLGRLQRAQKLFNYGQGVDDARKDLEYKNGGKLEDTNDPTYNALSNVIMERNRGKNFVDRAYNYQTSPVLNLGNGDYATHQMAYDTKNNGTADVYPTVIQQGNSLRKLNDDQAWDYAHDNNEFINVPSYKMAEYLSNKGYKNVTGLGKMINGGILGSNNVDYSVWNSSGYIDGEAILQQEAPAEEIQPSPSESQPQEEEETDEYSYSVPQITKIQNNEKSNFNYTDNTNNEVNGFSQRGNKSTLTGKPAKSTATGEAIYNGLIDRGMSKAVAAGFTGNAAAESGFDTSATNSIGAFGGWQWLGKRKKELLNFAKETGRAANDLNLQLDFLVRELSTTEKAAAKKLQNISDPSTAAKIIMQHFERPSSKEQAQSVGKRQKHALAYYKAENGTKMDSTSWLSKYNNL